jgi:hypothetical protein
MKASAAEQDANMSALMLPADAKPVDVYVGIFIHRIGQLSVKDNSWTADFDIWFRWTGDGIHPGENFEVVDGQIELREKKESYSKAGQQYERYHVRANIVKYFDASRFPFSDQGLVIQIEDGKDDVRKLQYVAEKQDIIISPQAFNKFLKITQSGIWVKLHNYAAVKKNHSRFIFGVIVMPPGVDIYIKMFQAVFASIAVSLIVFFIKPVFVDPRFGLCIGGFFAVVGNNIYLQSYLPLADSGTLVDMVNAIGMGTIFLILVQSAASLYIFETKGKEKLSRFFDRASFVVLLMGYVIVNLLLAFAAKS